MANQHITSLVSSQHIEHALALIVSCEMEGNSATQLAGDKLAQWRLAKPEHELAYHEALRQWQLLGNIAPQLKQQFQAPAAVPAEKRNGRHLASVACGLICIGALAKAGIWYWHQPVFEQRINTSVAQVQQLDLPDGTRLDINAQSDLKVTLYRDKREVTLSSGEVRFAVSHNADAPFNVYTREGHIQVVGTVFSVADRGRSVNVTVEQGHVRFYTSLADNSGTDMQQAGANLRPSNSSVQETVDLYVNEYLQVQSGQHRGKTRIDTADVAAWRDGWLVFNNTLLADAIPQINAFRFSPIVLKDSKTAQMRLTGRFLANDNQHLDQALSKILPVQVKHQHDGTTLLSAR